MTAAATEAAAAVVVAVVVTRGFVGECSCLSQIRWRGAESECSWCKAT